MLSKKLTELNLSDFDALCENSVLESRFIEFKAEAIGNGDKEKREFLADVSAFANASGGDMVLGIKTKDGAAQEVCGILLDDPDKEKLRLSDIVRFGLEPRYSALDIVWLPMAEKRGVMVIRVPRSWTAPHRVTFLKEMNFYVRNAAGRNPMSVDELRFAFNSSHDLAQRLRDFRHNRINAIQGGDLPVTLQDGPKLVLHFVPLSFVADPLDLQFHPGKPGIVPPLLNNSYTWQHTIEGFVTFIAPTPARSYSLMFRNGAVETAATVPIAERATFYFQAIEQLVIRGWKHFRNFAEAFGVEPPVYVFATLIGIKGFVARVGAFLDQPVPMRKDILPLPEVTIGIEQFADSPDKLFRRLFDISANAFGLQRSPSYDSDGNFIGKYPI